MNKRAESSLGEMVEMIPQLIVLTIIAVSVFGLASMFYAYKVSVRDVEARLLGRTVVDCLAGEGVVNLDNIGTEYYDKILSYCGVVVGERGYVGVEVLDSSDKEIIDFYEGDSGALWVRDLFELTGRVINSENLERVVKYSPGYFSHEYPVVIVKDGRGLEGKIKMEVLVRYEDE